MNLLRTWGGKHPFPPSFSKGNTFSFSKGNPPVDRFGLSHKFLGERDRSGSPAIHYPAMQFDSPSGEPPTHRGQQGCDSRVFQWIPIAVLFRSSRRLTSPTRQQASTLLSPPVPSDTPTRQSIHPSIHQVVVGGVHCHRVPCTPGHLPPLSLLHKGHPVPSIPCPDSKPNPGWGVGVFSPNWGDPREPSRWHRGHNPWTHAFSLSKGNTFSLSKGTSGPSPRDPPFQPPSRMPWGLDSNVGVARTSFHFDAFDAHEAPPKGTRMECEGRDVLRNVMNAPAMRVRASKALPNTPGSPMDVDGRTPRRSTRKMRHAEAENFACDSPLGSPPPMYEASGKKGSREAMLEAENARLARCAAEFEATLKRMRETESRSHVEARRQLTDLEAKNRRLTEEHEQLLQNFQQLTDKYHAYKEKFQQARESDQAWQAHLKQVNAQCDKEVSEIRKEKEDAVKKMQDANARLEELKKCETEASKRAEGAERTAQLATTRADENERLLKDAESRYEAAASSVGELKKELDTQRESFNRSEKALKESKQTAKTMQKALDEYKRENSRSHTALQEALRRIDALERDNAQLADMCSSAVAQLERMQLSPGYSD